MVNRLYGEKPKKLAEEKQELEEEIGDVFFTLISLADAQKIDLEETLERVLKKLNHRDKNRWTKKRQA